MNRLKPKKIIVKLLFALMLSFSIISVFDLNTATTALAAEKAPSVKEKEITLYVGYKDYKISFDNLAKGAAISYKSSNKKIASVSSSGVIKPLSAGKASILATVKQNKKTYNLKLNITVKKPYIKLTQSVNYLNVGETAHFKAKVYGRSGAVSWSSSNEDVISVSSDGKVTAKKAGKATVYAKVGKISTGCKIDIGSNRLGSYSKDITLYNNFTIWINVTGLMEGETLDWHTSKDIISCSWADSFDGNRIALTIKPKKTGKDTLTVTSNKSNDKLFININVIGKPKNKKVLSAEEIYEQCGQSTVEIYAYYNDGVSMGSGFYADKGMIVTNYHVIEGAERIIVKTYDEKKIGINTIVGYDKELDLAILGIDRESTPLCISQDKVAAGQDVYAIGSPYGLTGTMSKGMVTAASRKMDNNVDYIQIDASISEGNSGGPLINKYGEVIGITTMYMEDGQNLNFAINIKELQKINTNRPMSITEYNSLYEHNMIEDMLANAIAEDPQKSRHMDNCQEIPSNTAVIGNLRSDEDWDVYKFEMDYYGCFYAFIYYKNGIGINDTYFVLMDDYDNFYFAEQGDDNYISRLYEVYLSPGIYYMAVMHTNDDYSGEDIQYIFYNVRTFG